MAQNVTVPLTLLKNLVALLEYWDVSLFDRAVRDDYWDALWALRMKLLRLDLREAYARIIQAPDEEARHAARIAYMQLKRQLEAFASEAAF